MPRLPPHPGVVVQDSIRGQALCARSGLAAGEIILEHWGERLGFAEAAARVAPDHVMEVADGEVFLASGDIDDYVNHSCEPNCRLDFRPDGRVFLVALRDIAAGEELSFDYATTTTLAGIAAFPGWRFACLCGAPGCRGEVSCAEELPPERRAFYEQVDALAPHVRKVLFAAQPVALELRPASLPTSPAASPSG
jgi:hypothetical protein